MTTQVVQAGSRVTVKAEAGTDGRDASREAFDAGLIANPTISAYTAYVAAMVATGGGSNAATLNGQPGSYYLNASNLASGTVPAERLPEVSFASLTGKPTTIAGYGITDAVTTFAQLGGKPTTLAGYGITNAQPLDADLTALAALTGTNTVYYRSAADTWSPVSFGSGLTFSNGTLSAVSGGGGTVTSVAIANANGVSGTVTNPNTTPSIAITLGAITPTSVAASGVITASNISGTNTGDQTITLTGDVTGSGTGSFAATIANNAVTNAKLAQVATARFKGRTSAGTGNVEDLTGTQATALLDVATTSAKGLVGQLPGTTTTFWRGDGTYAAVTSIAREETCFISGDGANHPCYYYAPTAQTVQVRALTADGNTIAYAKSSNAAPLSFGTNTEVANAGTAPVTLEAGAVLRIIAFNGSANSLSLAHLSRTA